MKEYNVQLPHEIYISLLFLNGWNSESISEHLEEFGLADPSTSYLRNLESAINPSPSTSMEDRELNEDLSKTVDDQTISILKTIKKKVPKESFDLLDHPDREFLDVLCILYRRDLEKIKSELESQEIFLSLKVLEGYVTLFWQPLAIDSRHKWKKFLKSVDEDSDDGEESPRNLYKLARWGEEDLVFWKLQKPRKTRDKKKDLEYVRELITMKILETKRMKNDSNNAKLIYHLSSQLVDITKQLHEMETESDFENIVEYFKNNIELENEEEEAPKSLEEVSKENKQLAEVVPIKNKSKGKGK